MILDRSVNITPSLPPGLLHTHATHTRVKWLGLGPDAATHWSVGGLMRRVKTFVQRTRQKDCMFLYLSICSVYLSSFTLGLFVWVHTRDWLSPFSLIPLVCFHTCLLLFPFVVRLLPYQSAVLLPLPGNDCGAHSFKRRKNNQVQVIRARWVRLKEAGLSVRATEKWTISDPRPHTGKNVESS